MVVVVGRFYTSLRCVFFFSSRRRHTRFDCDWSSDVCSSDLIICSSASRKGLITVYEQMIEAAITRRRAEDMGQFSLFGAEEPAVRAGTVDIPFQEWDKKVKLAFEREMLGLYVS